MGWAVELAGLALILFGALFMIGSVPLSAAEPVQAAGEATVPIVRIPTDHPLPEPGARVVVPVPAGGHIYFDLGTFDPSSAQVFLEGADLVLRLEDGGELVLEGFFASVDPPAAIVLGEELAVSAEVLLALLGYTEEAWSDPQNTGAGPGGDRPAISVEVVLAAAGSEGAAAGHETAAGPMAAGGGEIFGIVQVVSWLLGRLDLVSELQAAEPQQLAQGGQLAQFLQLEAQLLIARETEVANLAAEYEAATGMISGFLKDRLDRGGGSRTDVEQGRAFLLEAQLEVKEANFRLTLAVDAHQDSYGERLETAAVPTWQKELPSTLNEVTSRLTSEHRALTRKFWRQASYARETIELLETLVVVARNVRDAYRDQFEVAQRTLLDVQHTEKILFQARVRLVQRQIDLSVAEAWLLAAMDQLSPDHIKHPGWQ